MRPQPPTESVANMKHLTSEQRYAIKILLQNNSSLSDIAQALNVHTSTISRELRRNCDNRGGQYHPDLAHRKYEKRKQNKTRKIVFTTDLKQEVKDLLQEKLSPEQISGRMKLDGKRTVSHESIYRWIWDDKKQGGELYTHLRRQGRKYGKRGSLKALVKVIPNRVDIDHRPKIVDEKTRFGDLEIDTIIGRNHRGAILTLNDRLTGLVWIRKLRGKDATELSIEAIKALYKFKDIIHTITADNGSEFAKYSEIERKINVNFYFCKPYHSWERGANENINGLIRQYIPKGTDFSEITEQFISNIENSLNNRPRKRFKYLSPFEKFKQVTNNEIVAFIS